MNQNACEISVSKKNVGRETERDIGRERVVTAEERRERNRSELVRE